MKKLIIILSLVALLTIAACAQEDTILDEDMISPEQETTSPIDDEQIIEQEIPQLVAIINGDEILRDDVEAIQSQMQMQGMQVEVDAAINQLITHKLLVQEAQRQGYEVTQEEIEARFEAQGLPSEQIREILAEQNMNYDDFIEEQIKEAKLLLLIEDTIQSIEITSDEAEQFYIEQAEIMGLEETFEELEEDIKYFLAEQQANTELSLLAQDLLQTAEVEMFY